LPRWRTPGPGMFPSLELILPPTLNIALWRLFCFLLP
jgi:hypothetical protein